MNEIQLEQTLDDVIKKFREDASKSTDYCTSETFDSFKALSDAMTTALESLKSIILYEKIH